MIVAAGGQPAQAAPLGHCGRVFASQTRDVRVEKRGVCRRARIHWMVVNYPARASTRMAGKTPVGAVVIHRLGGASRQTLQELA